MTAPLSNDLRLRVVLAIEGGFSRRAAASRIDVSIASAVRWYQRYKRTGGVDRDAIGGDRHSHRAEAHAAKVLRWVDENRDITLVEIADRLAAEGHVFALATIWRLLDPHDYTVKKTAHAAEQERADVKAAREAWSDRQLEFEPARLIFLDECGTNTKMARLYARSRRGKRCRAAIPHGHWKTTTLLAALCTDGIIAPMVMDGAMDGEMFSAYVKILLAPCLKPGDIVIMDNLPAANQRPVAKAGQDQVIRSGLRVSLDGSGSTDPDGDSLSYRCSEPAGVSLSDPTAATPTFVAPRNTGEFEFTLVVTDSQGLASVPDTVTVTVNPAPLAALAFANTVADQVWMVGTQIEPLVLPQARGGTGRRIGHTLAPVLPAGLRYTAATGPSRARQGWRRLRGPTR